MKFVIDSDIPFASAMFSGRADVTTVPGNLITPDSVRDADVLIVRSVTRVDERLIGGSNIRFVGTATIGVDHVDLGYLQSRGIGFASAPGCNATSVAEYVMAALLELGDRDGFRLAGKTIGVVGVGNVGSRVAAMASALGMQVLLNDPPLARATGDGKYLPLPEVLGADIVTIHVRLTRNGPDPTFHLFDKNKISAMKQGSVLINTSRGAVVDTPTMKDGLKKNHIRAAVLDVWEGEPSIDIEALSLAAIGTPHIAGYSADGKANGALMMYRAVCDHLGWDASWVADGLLPGPPHALLEPEAVDPEDFLRSAVGACYPIMRDDASLRKILILPAPDRDRYFIGLRNRYPIRREFSATKVRVPGGIPGLEGVLKTIGFRTCPGVGT